MTTTSARRHHFRPVIEQLTVLRKGAAEVIREEDLRARLEASRAAGVPLRVKLGVDPTAPDLHLGHTVVLRKLRHFQNEGHTAIFLIGDFTALVGDPTGQSETRPPLSPEQVRANSETYLAQVYKILDPQRTEVRYNSEWLGKLTSFEIVRLCGHYRLARMLEREDFRSRLHNNQPISVHELLYPLLQAYDSVVLKADIELGATEQKFNLLVGRDIQQEYGQQPQVALTMPILVGLDGQRKMSKSLGNYVGITESPSQMFGKLMSISDPLMWSYYELLTDFPEPVLVRLKQEVDSGLLHPMDAKIQLARTIIAGFHGEQAAQNASTEFQRVFRQRQAPAEIPQKKIAPGDYPLPKLLALLGLAQSRTDAERLIKQGAIELNGRIISNPSLAVRISGSAPGGAWTLQIGQESPLSMSPGESALLRAGKKRFIRLLAG